MSEGNGMIEGERPPQEYFQLMMKYNSAEGAVYDVRMSPGFPLDLAIANLEAVKARCLSTKLHKEEEHRKAKAATAVQEVKANQMPPAGPPRILT